MVQAILLAAFPLIFLLTAAKMKLKRLVVWLFGIVVFIHVSGLSLRGHCDLVDNIIVFNGIALLLLVGYMSYEIYIRFVRKRRT